MRKVHGWGPCAEIMCQHIFTRRDTGKTHKFLLYNLFCLGHMSKKTIE